MTTTDDLPQPHCEEHDSPADFGGSTLALNDGAGLRAIIATALGAPVTTTTTFTN